MLLCFYIRLYYDSHSKHVKTLVKTESYLVLNALLGQASVYISSNNPHGARQLLLG